jgi:hypothetical protein
MLYSAERITQLIDTGRTPVKVFANDLYDYIAKGALIATRRLLVVEWFGSELAYRFGLAVPHYEAITILPEHRPNPELNARVNVDWSQPFFGSRFEKKAEILDNQKAKGLLKAFHKDEAVERDVCEIALFDLFLSMDDRHEANMNLLVKKTDGRGRLHPIDFESAFQTGAALEHELSLQTEQDMVLRSTFFRQVIKSTRDFDDLRNSSLEKLSDFVGYQRACVDEILATCPEEWMTNPDIWRSFFFDQLLSDKWLQQVTDEFVTQTNRLRQ